MAHVLLIDDNDGVRDVFARGLRYFGHEVDTAASGPAALRTLEVSVPDLILTDMYMDGMSGFATIQQVRARGVSVPIVAMSGGPLPPPRTLGVERVVRKPIGLEDLDALVNELVEPRVGADPLTAWRVPVVVRSAYIRPAHGSMSSERAQGRSQLRVIDGREGSARVGPTTSDPTPAPTRGREPL